MTGHKHAGVGAPAPQFVKVACVLHTSLSRVRHAHGGGFVGSEVWVTSQRLGGTRVAFLHARTPTHSPPDAETGRRTRRNKSSMRAEASAGLEKSFVRAARRSTEPVSLRQLLSHSGIEKKVRRTTSRWTKHWRTRGCVHIEEYKLDKPKRTFDPANRLAHGVVEEWSHARKYCGVHILEGAT